MTEMVCFRFRCLTGFFYTTESSFRLVTEVLVLTLAGRYLISSLWFSDGTQIAVSLGLLKQLDVSMSSKIEQSSRYYCC